jgi:nicotinamidase-related amidase
MVRDSLSESLDGKVALIASATSAASVEIASAQAAGALILQVDYLDNDSSPWEGRNLPGTIAGCGHWPGDAPHFVRIRTDRHGIYFAAVADLLLRSNDVRVLRLAGDMPEQFVRSVEMFASQRGYRIASPTGLRPVDGLKAGETAFSSLAQRVAPGAAALILIDVQNDFCAPEGATGRSGQPMEMIETAVERIKVLLAAARRAGLFVVHVRAEYGELFRSVGSPHRYLVQGRREPAVWTASAADLSADARVPNGQAEVCLPGSWGSEFVSGVEPGHGEPIVTKHRFSAFVDTGLDSLLRANGIRSAILAGVTTNCCVESTARDAAMRDYHVVVASDCVAVKDHLRDLHDATLESLGLYFGLVRPSSDIISAWSVVCDAKSA